jgi:hypothetical protein
VAARSKAWVCGRSFEGVTVSNPARGMNVCLLWVLVVLSGRGLCFGLITRPEESIEFDVSNECDGETP